MSHSFSRLAGLILVMVGVVLLAVNPAGAAGLPQQAGVAGGMYNWYPLAPGQSVEWVFHYPGHGDAALIAFGVDPANSIKVDVYTDDQWRSLGAGIWPVEPVGRGTPGTLDQWSGSQDLIDSGDLFWEAVTWPEVIFHIQIANASQAPARYWIAQGGPGAGELAPYAPIAAISPTVPDCRADPVCASPGRRRANPVRWRARPGFAAAADPARHGRRDVDPLIGRGTRAHRRGLAGPCHRGLAGAARGADDQGQP